MPVLAVFKSLPFRMAALSLLGLLTLTWVASHTIRDHLERDRIALVHAVADVARSVAASYDGKVRRGELSLEEATRRAREDIRAMRYRGDRYLFVVRTDGIMLVHPSGVEWEGKDLSHDVDAQGVAYYRSMIDRAREGGGPTFLLIARPGHEEASRRVAYSVFYKPWGWTFGTMVSLDDIDHLFWSLMRGFAILSGLVTVVITAAAYLVSKRLLREVERRRIAERQALHSSKLASIGQLAAGLAHEINTPVQYIGDNIRFLSSEEQNLLRIIAEGTTLSESEAAIVSEDLSSAARESLEGVARISRIVSSLKEFALPGADKQSTLDVNKALEDTLTVSQHAWAPVAEVERHFAPDLPTLECHVSEVNQVFLSILLNAVHAIAEGGKDKPGRIVLETVKEDGEIVIRIADNGPGIPEDLRERIFDPFFTTKPVGVGVGQGLAVSRDTIEVKCGGRLEAGGKPGEGALFTVRLPIDAPKHEAKA